MVTTFRGSCHCGAIRYEADIDLNQGTGRCNCTFCLKARAWATYIKPEAFRLAAGSEEGVAYHQHAAAPVKYHCPRCGVRTHARGDADYMGGPFVGVFVATLDDASPEELLSGPVRYYDGLHNNWGNPPAETGHL
ncbi:MAG TPA: GFA family protein [Steroidobacteraceae bacterium]|nr:GFA family protein [Steroidobacteraceae bacterium]